MKPTGLGILASGVLAPSTTVSLSDPTLRRADRSPLIVESSGTAAVSEDLAPTGSYGVVTMPGIPLSVASGRPNHT
jgi:hypothetical protein